MANQLYPVFLKLSNLNILVVGGGNVALEKLTFLLKSSPNANVELVAKEISDNVSKICSSFKFNTHEKPYDESYLEAKQIVLVATDNEELNKQVVEDAHKRNILVNVADKPSLCDFYLGGVVTKGNIKIAISTNGTSPTLAKRLRQFLEELLPNNISELADTLNQYRNQLKGNFQHKVDRLNELTKDLITNRKRMN